MKANPPQGGSGTGAGNSGGNRGGKPGVFGGGGNGGGGGGGPSGAGVVPPFWIPMCYIVPPGAPSGAVNNVVKANEDALGRCGIAGKPFVFRVKSIPDSADAINRLAQSVCPLNRVFGVGGSAVQTFAPYPKTADEMCGNYDKDGNLKEDVAGCAALGNGNSGGALKSFFTSGRTGYGKGGNTGGVPSPSIVDSSGGYSPGVSCHEFGHSIGGPGRGGDFLVNVGDGQPEAGQIPAQAGMGLEAQTQSGGVGQRPGGGGGAEGAGLGGACNFTEFGCASLRGGANFNTRRFRWDPKQQTYFFDRPTDPIKWDLMAGKSFFDYKDPLPKQPSYAKSPPSRRGGDETLVLRDSSTKEGNAQAGNLPGSTITGGHKKGGNTASGNGSDALISSVRNTGARGGALNNNMTRSAPNAIPGKGQKDADSTIVLRDSTTGSQGPDISSVSTSGNGASGDGPKDPGSGNGSANASPSSSSGTSGSSSDNGVGASLRNNASAKANGDDLDPDFFKKIQQQQKKQRRTKGSSLRPNMPRDTTSARPVDNTSSP